MRRKHAGNLVNNAVAIKVADKDIATVNASMLGSAMRIDANQQSKLKDNEVRNGYVVLMPISCSNTMTSKSSRISNWNVKTRRSSSIMLARC